MLRRLLKLIFNRISIVIMLICVQIAYFIFMMLKLSAYSQYISWIFTFVSALVVIYLISREDNPSFRLAWCILVLSFPVFGWLFYLIVMLQSSNKEFGERMRAEMAVLPPAADNETTLKLLAQCSEDAAIQASYLVNSGKFTLFNASGAKYLPIGEAFFDELVERLKSAEKYIFMEYFIISVGTMWEKILSLLEEKAKAGVDVRIIYDSMGSLFLLPSNYSKTLEAKGIRCMEFNRFRPTVSTIQNNRDHRKICVIDGRYAFTGGINIGDEYINAKQRCGHWKDNSVMIIGDAVKSFTGMFLEMWNSCCDGNKDFDYFSEELPKVESDGFMIPYCDSPWDREYVSESVYLNVITKAKKYLYITTPYFIIGEEFIKALELAAKSGVDVRVITPHIWDKHFVYIATRACYERLIMAGIRVYEYTPGFIHCKTFLCDDEIATVGTANVDYRSMYLQYECGVWMFGCRAVKDIKADIEDILSQSAEVTLEDCKKRSTGEKIIQKFIQPFAPLM